ncbi:MAG: aminotransferase class V-fold PLP-dependent enzyme [Thaumarchaeota archaeon]|nr:aminotransferase class V-fold PLP-dependent enzyme [Nitrososphaerota archaeon]
MATATGEFPLAEKYAYLNTAGVGLIPRSVVEGIQETYGRYLTTPPYEDLFEEFREGVEKARQVFAPFIGARPEEVSFQPNSSTALNLVVQMLDPKKGENVVADDLGFPSDIYPLLALKKKGVEVRIVKNRNGLVTAEDYSRSVDDKTKLVMLSYVSWVNGMKFDDIKEIAALAKRHGAYTMVDTTHGTGYLDIDVEAWGVDFLATSNYKWLLSPFGAAEFFCARRNLESFQPPHVGWNSTAGGTRTLNAEEFTLAKHAKRFEPGNPDYIAIRGLTGSLRFISKVGMSKIRARTLGLVGEIMEGVQRLGMDVLTPADKSHGSGVVLVTSRVRSGAEIARALAKKGVLVSDRYYHGGNGIRISPYFYNDSTDVERLLSGLKIALN